MLGADDSGSVLKPFRAGDMCCRVAGLPPLSPERSGGKEALLPSDPARRCQAARIARNQHPRNRRFALLSGSCASWFSWHYHRFSGFISLSAQQKSPATSWGRRAYDFF